MKAAFLDRDGTIIYEYAKHPEEVELIPGVIDRLRALHTLGYALFLASNQPDFDRDPGLHYAIHDKFDALMRRSGVYFTRYYYCRHRRGEGCGCRKPKPGLLLRAAREYDIDMGESWMIGDRASDAKAARAAGCRFCHAADFIQKGVPI
jgi:histidinol-phosphate phosphatase family protein